jgi:glyoxylase-like metal-dependent hydrolase (beta-lactamase superfamily II)
MNNDTYCFMIGSYECLIVSDGTLTYAPPMFPPPASFLFTNAPKTMLIKALGAYGLHTDTWMSWVSPYLCIVINTGDHRVLIDTGAGALAPSTGKLLSSLRAEGIHADAIDTVILTHGHPDHLGGNTRDGDVVFPNAQFVVSQIEWEFWTSTPDLKADEHTQHLLVTTAENNLLPLADCITCIRHEEEVVPGIRVIPASGHTPGHMVVEVSSDNDRLLCISDAVLHPIHVEHPDWHAVVDILPEHVLTTRQQLFKRVVENDALVLAFHFPFPGLGHIIESDKGWKWHPLC